MNIDLDLFSIERAYQKPGNGRVLISEPFLQDLYFKRTVVFLTEHNEEGTVGFVLNKPINLPFSEVVNDFPDINASISIGGPVNTNTLHYIHTYGDIIPQSVEVIDGIYWGGDFDLIKSMIENKQLNPSKIRFFLGYSGWQGNQLENEMEENSWVVTDLPSNIIMDQDGPDIWKHALSKLGGKYKMWANFPENPGLN